MHQDRLRKDICQCRDRGLCKLHGWIRMSFFFFLPRILKYKFSTSFLLYTGFFFFFSVLRALFMLTIASLAPASRVKGLSSGEGAEEQGGGRGAPGAAR